MLRDGVVVRDGVLYSVYLDPVSRRSCGIQARARERAILAGGVCVAGSTHSVETWKSQGNDQPLTMIGTRRRTKTRSLLLVVLAKGGEEEAEVVVESG